MKEETPVIEASSRGLRYGDGLFETMRYKNGRLELADEHFARLWKGLQMLHFQVPKLFTPEKLEAEIGQLAQKNGHAAARVRLTVFRASGGLYDPSSHAPQYIIECMELLASSGNWNSNGLVTGIYPDAAKSMDNFCNLKHNNFLPYLMGAIYATEHKWNDAIVLNSAGRICDSTIANIFLIKDETLYTPALVEGCIAGVMRNHLIRHSATIGFQVVEKPISIAELQEADEVFFTNSIYLLRWVQDIGGKVYQNLLTRKIFDAILPTIY